MKQWIASPFKRYLLTVCILLTLSTYAHAQQRTIRGTVSGENSQPLEGATISLKQTGEKTTTDKNGLFSLSSATANGTLVISYVGYSGQEITLDDRTELSITLQKTSGTFDEVVVIGYGTAKKKNIAGSVDVVTGKSAGATTATSPAQLLIGKSAGVQIVNTNGTPGSGAQIIIRGTGSLRGVDPLYVIDGIQGSNNLFNSLNTQDIENITILKDASLTAIYGASAANGVVIVTTKKGKSGLPRVSFSSQAGISRIPKKLDVLKAADYVDFLRDISISKNQVLPAKLNTPAVLIDSTDWQSAILRNALSTENTISLTGGSDKVIYQLSGGYITQQSISGNFINKRLNLRFGLDETFGRFHFGQTLVIRNVKSKGSQASLVGAISYAPYKPILDSRILGGYSTLTNGDDFSDVGNPLQNVNLTRNITDEFLLYPQLFGEVRLVKGLKFRTQFAGIYGASSAEGYRIPYVGANNVLQDRQATLSTGKSSYYILENYFTYNLNTGNHNFSFTGGNSYTDKGKSVNQSALGTGIPNDNIQSINVASNRTVTGSSVGYAATALISYFGRLTYDYNNKYFISLSARRDGASNFGINNKNGNFPGGGVAWVFSEEGFIKKSLPFITEGKLRVSYGRLGNNQIPNFLTDAFTYTGQSNNGSVGYAFGTTEAFVPGVTINTIPNPDLRWEQTDQVDIGLELSLFESRINFSADLYRRKSKGLLVSVPLPTDNGIGGVGGGGSSILTNAADAQNEGLELSLTYNSNPGRKLNYSVSTNFAYNRNKVLSLGEQFQAPILAGSFNQLSAFTYTAAGSPIGAYYGYQLIKVAADQAEINVLNQSARDKTGNANAVYQASLLPGDFIFRDLNGDGVVTATDQKILGSPIPKFVYGFNANAAYGSFDLNVVTSGIAGVKVVNANKYFTENGTTGHNASTAILNRWRKPGDQAALPRAGQNATAAGNLRVSDFWVNDGSYLRLRSVTLGYNVPKKMLDGMKEKIFTTARLYIAAQNLLTVTTYDGFDPEISTLSGGDYIFTRGFDNGQLPQPRTFLVGLQLGF